MRHLLLCTLILLLSDNQSQSQATGNVNYNNRKSIGNSHYQSSPQNVLPNASISSTNGLTFDVRVLSNQQASSYVAIFNLTQVGKTAAETNDLMRKRYDHFVQPLKSVGIVDSMLHLDMLSFIPLYEYEVEKKLFSKNNNEVPKGFELQQNVHIAFSNQVQFAAIMKAAAAQEIYDLVKIDYVVEDQEAIYTEMRQRAVANLTEQLDLYQKALGIDLTNAQRTLAEDKQVVFPEQRYSAYKAFANVSSSDVTEKGKTRDMYKPSTRYYDKVNYTNFDIVLHPNVVEPAVQYLYHIQLYIQLMPTKNPNEPTNNYFWLTPEGEAVPVKPNTN